jgi:3-oxoacyl-[acyl-carrier-protein] synthase II
VIALVGAGHVLGEAADPTPFLKVRKSRKFMGPQDDLAVVATGRALAMAGLVGPTPAATSLGDRAGLYLAVGHIPFHEADIDPVLEASLDDRGEFDLQRFGRTGFLRAHPLLTFRCLPNMPAYHVSANVELTGPYLVTYPGPGELAAALEEAAFALESGSIDVALVGAVAEQRNFLVEHHFARIDPPTPADALRNGGAFLVLEARAHAEARGARVLGTLVEASSSYEPRDVLREGRAQRERCEGFDPGLGDVELGPARLPVALSLAIASGHRGAFAHHVDARDGVSSTSRWELA